MQILLKIVDVIAKLNKSFKINVIKIDFGITTSKGCKRYVIRSSSKTLSIPNVTHQRIDFTWKYDANKLKNTRV